MDEQLPEDRRDLWAVGATGFVNATFKWWMESDRSMDKDSLITFIVQALLTRNLDDDDTTSSTHRS